MSPTKPFSNPYPNFCERYAQVRVGSAVIIIAAVSMMDGAAMTRRGGCRTSPTLPRLLSPFNAVTANKYMDGTANHLITILYKTRHLTCKDVLL